ncbi:site-specific integrase [Nocardioides immobilis]|uniref:Site-specific integrase n=1 Tax=Nocardioides immobilis TaxID=2049295 RepID=A0A417XYK2_9ACTN|nr:site-specific integrase [Nocardioides immobilis]RHW25446.1 site-specific integrase [Nocardioides immobilis]
MARPKTGRPKSGTVETLPSGKYRVRFTGPDGKRYAAPITFEDVKAARLWLDREVKGIEDNPEAWRPPGKRVASLTFGEYAERWLETRKVKGKPLAARTRAHYRALLDQHILPTFGDVPLRYITHEAVDDWYERTAVNAPTLQAHAYSLLRTILGTAVDRGILNTANPAKIRGGGSTKRVKKIRPASLSELETVVSNLPERYRLMALLAAWCALRFGELAELRRGDVDTKGASLRIRRGVVRAAGETIVKVPKSDAGSRDVAIPPHLMPLVREHLLAHAEAGADGLLFPAKGGGQLAPSTLYRVYYPAREAAGRPDLRWHDLRHTGATLAAQTGATLAELMGRLGHSTPSAALRYQHAAKERDVEIARRLSEIAGAEQ